MVPPVGTDHVYEGIPASVVYTLPPEFKQGVEGPVITGVGNKLTVIVLTVGDAAVQPLELV
jgi:hypothetical protein